MIVAIRKELNNTIYLDKNLCADNYSQIKDQEEQKRLEKQKKKQEEAEM